MGQICSAVHINNDDTFEFRDSIKDKVVVEVKDSNTYHKNYNIHMSLEIAAQLAQDLATYCDKVINKENDNDAT